jgi:hypothetical protein
MRILVCASWLMLATLVLTSGCQSSSWAEQARLEQQTVQPTDKTFLAKDLLPLRKHAGHRRIRNGNKPEQKVAEALRPSQEPGQGKNRWIHTVEGVSTTYLQQEEDGSIRVVREESLDDGVRVEYEPALLYLPAQLQPGQEYQAKSTMKVFNLKDGSPRGQGENQVTIKLLGVQPVAGLGTDRELVVVQTSHAIDLNVADAKVQIYTRYRPGQGIKSENLRQQTILLGLLPSVETKSSLVAD